MQLSSFQKFLSYFHPVKIRTGSSERNPVLELFHYKGQWQLATKDAIYSDGDRYRPLRLAFDKIKDRLLQVNNVLILGTGLGSAAVILERMGYHPALDLVEIDPVVIKWARELLPDRLKGTTHFIIADAANFMAENRKKYDLIVVDIFQSRSVPDFVMKDAFLKQCKNSLSGSGTVVINYIVEDKDLWAASMSTFKLIFTASHIYDMGVNRVMIGQ